MNFPAILALTKKDIPSALCPGQVAKATSRDSLI